MTKPIVAVVLSGCGVYDGSEIHEAVLTLLAIDRHGAEARCFAPDILQTDVIDHRRGEATGDSRNVLTELARIARGAIQPLAEFDPAKVDALILPGGFGAAKNLSSFATEGAGCSVLPELAAAIRGMVESGKPVGALCIAPVILARVLGAGVELTIGNDPDTARAVGAMGAHHVTTGPGGVTVDKARKVATAPCYMLDFPISRIWDGADGMVAALLEMARP